MAGPDPPAQWPPRSPQEALLSTPGGRAKVRRMGEQVSLSPSPLRKSRSLSALIAGPGNAASADLDDADEDEEDDEEILQLKLKAIEAKLKLKALQKKKKHALSDSSDAETASPALLTDAARKIHSRAAAMREDPRLQPRSQTDIQVPASPIRRAPTAQAQTSPSRVLLGIDKGLKAKDVSLKRASSLRSPRKTQQRHDGQTGGYLRRTHTPALSQAGSASTLERPKSFSERLAAARTQEASRQDRQERIRKVRSKAFDVDQQQMERFKNEATEIPESASQAEAFSRDEVLAGGMLQRSKTAPSLGAGDSGISEASSSGRSQNTKPVGRKQAVSPSEVPEAEATSFEPYSAVHLSKRILPHSLLARTFSGKKTLLIKDLLRDVKAPNFELPEFEQDIVVLAIVASKSEPRTHKVPDNGTKEKKGRFAEEEQRGKYMIIKLVDLQWELDLFLFNSAFQRYWKLIPGTLIAILNPSIMPPPRGREATGRFSLVLNSDGDTVLEVGTARDLGFCKSIKKDGEMCNSWVNKKRTEFCEFHMNLALDKHRLARQEVNVGFGIGPPHQHASREIWQRDKRKEYAAQAAQRSGEYDKFTHSHYFVSFAASAASLIDGDQMLPGQVADRVERGDALRRRLAHEEKEREIMKQLGKTGRGAGREYMRLGEQRHGLSSTATAETSSQEQPEQRDAKSLGLLARKDGGTKIHLSPIKRKRVATNEFNSGSSSAPSAGARNDAGGLGWGSSLKNKLAKMKEGERLLKGSSTPESAAAGEQKPARKRTRFITEKGIREPGRESLGGELGKEQQQRMVELDDDDELLVLPR